MKIITGENKNYLVVTSNFLSSLTFILARNYRENKVFYEEFKVVEVSYFLLLLRFYLDFQRHRAACSNRELG